VAEELTASTSRPIPKDHLDLIRALIEAGKFSRAIELLDSVWQLDSEHEQAWFLRLWAKVGEGKEGAALELARTVTPRLPGSSAIAYLQAHLEEHAGDPRAALEAALRAAAASPERPEPRQLIHRLVQLVAEESRSAPTVPVALPQLPPDSATEPLSLMGAALQGAAMLHPSESNRAHVPVIAPRIRQPDAVQAKKSLLGRRFGLLAFATVVAALWAIPDPVPAAITLAIVVVLVTRLPGPRR
jgi:tetratricopeptide (TPR) repeat protein